MYCKNCGGKIEPGQKFCANCGAEVIASFDETPVTVTDSAEKYKPQIMKISILNLCSQILGFLLIATLLFLPIFISTPTDLDAIQDWDELEEVMENDGKLSFSYWDEITLIFDAIFPNEEEKTDNENSYSMYDVLLLGMFPLLQLMACVVAVFAMCIPSIYEQINNIRKADDFTLLRYDEIKKNGSLPLLLP